MLESARHQWEEGNRRLESEAGDSLRYHQLVALVETVIGGLRRRVGQHYTLGELSEAYAGAEDWVRQAVKDATPPKARAGVRDAALVQDAAFYQYARGATDYRP